MFPVDEALQNILLDVEIVIGDVLKLPSQFGKILHRFTDPVVRDIVGGGLGP
jgi:hypothetical protein